ncbi:MAG: dTDP-4-dehydrorhamnose reductase [Actinomycetota bacterium]|nr:dTDP-4-dehydrorhamnose reductase [Actinomycetota bacterium]
MVGREVVEALAPHDVVGLDHAALDVGDRDSVLGAIGSIQPDAIVHCAAMTAVDACESEPDRAFLVNALGVRFVMEGARRAGAYVVALSTDYVFDGTQPEPYHEWDTPNPASVYGASKLGGEFEIDLECAVVRTSWVIGRYGPNMAKTILRLAGGETPLRFVDDQRGCPTVAADLATMLRMFVVERLPGTWHVTNQGAVSWFEFAQEVLRAAGDDPARVAPIATADLDPPRPAPRPANSVLDNRALRLAGRPLLPDFRESLPILVQAIR